jgi:hypothetical protein
MSALAVGGFPPLGAPFAEMTAFSSQMAASALTSDHLNPKLLLSPIGFYAPLVSWAERENLEALTMPRLAFIGVDDVGVPSLGVDLPLAARVRANAPALQEMGWQIEWLEGQDHLSAISPQVSLPPVHDFFRRALLIS